MKLFFKIFSLFVLTGSILACSDDNKDAEDNLFLKLAEDQLVQQFDAEGGETTLTIEANVEFTASSDEEEWCKVEATPALGSENLKITVEPTTVKENRNATITVTAKGVSPITITVNQLGLPEGSGLPRIAVLSDVHLGAKDSKAKVTQALKVLLSKGDIDAVFVPGDITDYGLKSQYTQLKEVFSENVPANIPVYYSLGNHDWYSNDGGTPLENYAVMGQPQHQYVTIKGYPFITISSSSKAARGDDVYNDEAVAYLKEKLELASKEFPDKPIFVFYHVPLQNTTYGSKKDVNARIDEWGSNRMSGVVDRYPQVIAFSGHSHFPLGDPRSIHQDKFTSVNDGSSTYAEVEEGFSEGTLPPNNDKVTEGLIVSVTSNGDVELSRIDTYRDLEILPKWTVKAPHNGSAFIYKDKTNTTAPTFKTGASVTTDDITASSVKVTFSTATDDEVVLSYQIDIAGTNNEPVSTANIFSQHYLNTDTPAELSYELNGLIPGTTYKAVVTAIDSYGNKSTPINSSSFTTSAYTPDPSVTAPVADLFDVVFSYTEAKDISKLSNSVTKGSTAPTILYNSALKLYTASFPNSSSSYFKLDYENNTTILNALATEYTLETYFMAEDIASGLINPLSSMESGGLGFETDKGPMQLWMHVGGGYKKVQIGNLNSNEYYHMVATYNKAKGTLKTYLNGFFIAELQVSGNFSLPEAGARWFGIGGDANKPERGTAQGTFKGQVAIARLYSKEVSADEVYNLHKQITERQTMNNVEKVNQLITVDIPAKIASSGNTEQLKKADADGRALLANLASTQADVDNYIASTEALVK